VADLPVVVITSGGEREREQLVQHGVSFFLRKPVSYQELASAVKSLLERRKLRSIEGGAG
jgi:CheY-like chemotaxis protein